MNAMHPQLELLLQLQDLKSHRRELIENDPGREVEEQEFHVNVEEAVAKLDERIEELRRSCRRRCGPPRALLQGRRPRRRARHQRHLLRLLLRPAHREHECLGRNDELNHCEQCGRFLYVVAG
jgi:hypothetical protein